jgi:hypothetical protein
MVLLLTELHKQSVMSDVHSCHQSINYLSLGVSAYGALKLAVELAEKGMKALQFNPLAFVIVEGVKHYLHCSCNAVIWESDTSPPAPDMVQDQAEQMYSLEEALASVASGGIIIIPHGEYPGPFTIDRPVRLESQDGPVRIGFRKFRHHTPFVC